MSPAQRRPWIDVACAVGLTLAYAAFVIVRRHGDWARGLQPFTSGSVFYSAPVVGPFLLFLLERFRRRGELGARRIGIDVGVILLAASRMFWPIPLVSGHALFLTYGLATSRERVVRVAMAIVLAATAVVKIFVWHDASLLGGALVAVAAAVAWRRAG